MPRQRRARRPPCRRQKGRPRTRDEEHTRDRSSDRASAGRPLGRHASRRRKMAKRKGSSASGPRTRSKAAKEGREAREAENARRLDKLPLEVWDKILDHLESDDLFPLALSCRYFRQKQKELVERARQNGNPGLAWTTTLPGWGKPHLQGQPASADYLRFCSKEKVPSEVVPQKAQYIRRLAAFHGHLPLLQELLGHRWTINYHNQQIAWAAGTSSSTVSSSLF